MANLDEKDDPPTTCGNKSVYEIVGELVITIVRGRSRKTTIWRPSLPNPEIPLYQAIANAIADDVVSGRLAEGERLPPQRDLADELKVALTTVTRGYTEAERRGLVSGEVGRGTFVRRQESFHLRRAELEPTAVDLTMNSLLPYPMGRELADRMADVFSKGDAWSVLDYQPHYGSCRQREAGARLVERVGVDASAERVLVTSGAQHAMAVVFSTLANPGDLVLTGELTYSGMKSLANFLHIRLRGLLMDEEGIRPDALEAACATTEAKALYCMPTLQNPTTAVMSEKRRQEIVAIAEAYGLAVVEDDSYGFLLPDVKALGAYATKQALLLSHRHIQEPRTGTSYRILARAELDGRSSRGRDLGDDVHCGAADGRSCCVLDCRRHR